MTICCPCLISRIYDMFIYFYTLFFAVLSCAYCWKGGICLTFLMLIIYLAVLIAPGISVFTFVVSSLFFLYYVAGVIVSIKNKNALGSHSYEEKMVPASKAPPFYGNLEFFDMESQVIYGFYTKASMVEYFTHLQESSSLGYFMAYQPYFLDSYSYITSGKMICFHISLMIAAILGLIFSISLFPEFYGAEGA